jgi:hypothetical protein
LTQLFTFPTTNSNQTYSSNLLIELNSWIKIPPTAKHAKTLLSTARHYDIYASPPTARNYNKDWTAYLLRSFTIMTTLSHHLTKHCHTHKMTYLTKEKMQIKQLTDQSSQLNTTVILSKCIPQWPTTQACCTLQLLI